MLNDPLAHVVLHNIDVTMAAYTARHSWKMTAAGMEIVDLKRVVLAAAMRLVSVWQGHPKHSAGPLQFAAGGATALSPPTNAALSPAASHGQSVTQQCSAAEAATGLQCLVSNAACEACDGVEQVAESILQQVTSTALLID